MRAMMSEDMNNNMLSFKEKSYLQWSFIVGRRLKEKQNAIAEEGVICEKARLVLPSPSYIFQHSRICFTV